MPHCATLGGYWGRGGVLTDMGLQHIPMVPHPLSLEAWVFYHSTPAHIAVNEQETCPVAWGDLETPL